MSRAPSAEQLPLDTMPSTRRAILASLKRHGALRSRDLVDELGITVTAVRQQLDRLQQDGLVLHRREPAGRGRPAHVYELAPAAEEFFPKRYGDLTNELLGFLGGPDSDDVAELFERRRQRRLHDAHTRLAGLSLEGKVRELTRILDEDGYLADVEETDGGGWRIVEHNCAILSVASGFRQACTSEIRFISDALPEANVARVAHILSGAHVCAYEIRPRPS
ncbi:MAG TPA: winged helix-turn-helix transcriptional regulator [Acidimicrobiales bacterium]|jgi:DeoR family suf operon transcriptional repressor|nr:winged helix-turn-helix transcriptional regulator [Acidimicrobiales bacterium]